MPQALPPWSAGKGKRIGLRPWASNLEFGYRVSGLSKKAFTGNSGLRWGRFRDPLLTRLNRDSERTP